MSVGIGVITYNRQWKLAECLTCLRRETTEPYDLIVADDGSTDGTLDYLRDEQVSVVTGQNRGIAWNKNRALFTLAERKHEVILLFEDDCFVREGSWFPFWVNIVRQWGHVNYAGPWWPQGLIVRGEGTVDNPFFCTATTAQISGFRSDVVATVGYYDTRFRRFGHEHTEHSTRVIRAGFGGNQRLVDGNRRYDFICANHGLACTCDASFEDKASVIANAELLARLAHEPVYRDPWRTDYERTSLLGEVAAITRYEPRD
ncbi:MAG: glycosyltransferase family 2 protein [Janthinobacterium lividum]